MLNYSKFPNQNMVDGLQRYFDQGVLPGQFMTAVLSNDLKESFGRADMTNQRCMLEIVSWLYNEAPSQSWGSPENVKTWLERFVKVGV